MGTVALKPLNFPATPDGYSYYDQITFSSGSPPDRPQPGPNPPGGGEGPPGIWGPPGPWPSPPIAGIPGLPGGPGQQPPFVPPVLPPGAQPGGKLGYVTTLPDNITPPDQPSPDATWVAIYVTDKGPPALALMNPYAAPVR